MSPLLDGRQHCVIPYGTGVPIVARLIVANCCTPFTYCYLLRFIVVFAEPAMCEHFKEHNVQSQV